MAHSIWADGTNTITGNGGSAGTLVAYASVTGGTDVGGDVQQYKDTEILRVMVYGSTGGNSVFGFGGSGGYNAIAIGAPSGYGAGGGGNYLNTASGGANGIVIVWEYK